MYQGSRWLDVPYELSYYHTFNTSITGPYPGVPTGTVSIHQDIDAVTAGVQVNF